MQLIYNSDAFAVMQIDTAQPSPMAASAEAGTDLQTPAGAEAQSLGRAGFEIVDKVAKREIFIEGSLAEAFKQGVEALNERSPSMDDYDAYMEGFTGLMQQPVVVH